MAAEPVDLEVDIFKGETVARYHYGSRKQLFMPLGSKGFPPKTDDYTGGRVTSGIYDHNSEPFEVRDNWLLEPDPRRALPHTWTGSTTRR